MSCRLLSRQNGAVLTCDSGIREGSPKCESRIQTGQVEKRLIRTYAATLGWKRGSPPADGGLGKRRDVCPNCVPAELERVAKFRQDRDAKKKAKREAKELKRKVATERAQEREAKKQARREARAAKAAKRAQKAAASAVEVSP